MCILYGCIIKLNKTACHTVAISRCKLKTGPDIRADLVLALDPCSGQLVDSKGPVRFFTRDIGGSHLAELTDCEEPHVCVLLVTSVPPRLLPLPPRFTEKVKGKRAGC